MANTEAALFTRLIDRVLAIAEERAEANDLDVTFGDWQDAERGAAFSRLLRRTKSWAALSTDPLRPHLLVCSVEGPDDSAWGYAASEILDSASQGLPQDVLDRPTGDETARPYVASATEVVIEELRTGVYGLYW